MTLLGTDKIFSPTFFLLAAVSALIETSSAQSPVGPHGTDWELLSEFSDEFSGATLDTGKWHMFKFMNDEYEGGSGIDFITINRFTWLNSFTDMNDSDRNVFMSSEDGEDCVELQLRDDNLSVGSGYLDTNYVTHTAGVIQQNRLIKYGYIEVRAKTAPTNVSSAFWLDSVRPNHHREVDVFELYGTTGGPDEYGGCTIPNENRFLSNYILWDSCGGNTYFDSLGFDDYADFFTVADRFPTEFPSGFDHTADFHVYGILWEEDSMKIYVDGVLASSIDPARVNALRGSATNQAGNPAIYDWSYPMAVLFTLEGFLFLKDSPCSGVNASVANESMYIDYVRVYRRSASNELVTNGAFDSNTSGWSTSGSNGGSGTLSHLGSLTFTSSSDTVNYSESATGVMKLSVANNGSARSDLLVKSSTFSLEDNSVYRASFAIRSDEVNSTRDEAFIKFAVVESGNPTNVIYESEEYVDRDWAVVNHTFPVQGLSGSTFEIQFQVGGVSNLYTCDQDSNPIQWGFATFQNDQDFYFDDIALGKVGPTATSQGDCNTLSDPNFTEDDSSWNLNTYSTSATLTQGSGNAVVDITSGGSGWWEVTMSQAPVSLSASTDYEVTFTASCDVAGKEVNLKLFEQNSPYAAALDSIIPLSTTPTEYVATFSSGGLSGNFIMDFQLGGQGAAEFTFEEVSLRDVECGITDPPTPTEEYGCDQILNGDFSSGTDDWYLSIDAGNSAATMTAANDELKFDITQTGTESWQVSGTQVTGLLQPDFSYRLKFEGKADGPEGVVARVYSPDPYTVYYEEEFPLGSAYATNIGFFSPSLSSSESVYIEFQWGAQGTGQGYVDNVILEKTCVDTGSGGSNPPPVSSFGCDQITNGGFGSGLSDWYLNTDPPSSSATYSVVGGEMEVDITAGGTENWQVGVVQLDRTLENGKRYKVSFDLASSTGGSVVIRVVDGGTYDEALATMVAASNTTASYEYEFDYNGTTTTDGFIEFQFGTGGARVITVDNVMLEEEDCP